MLLQTHQQFENMIINNLEVYWNRVIFTRRCP